jgi:hypothetical protein
MSRLTSATRCNQDAFHFAESGEMQNIQQRTPTHFRDPKKERARYQRSVKVTAFAAALAAFSSCKDAPPRPDEAPPPPPPPTARSAPAASIPSAVPTDVPAAAADSLTGTWEGSYDAKKGTVGLPANVKDKTWSKDDGKIAVGPGTITVTITPSGDLTGKGKGALGASTLSGHVDGNVLRASVLPDDPLANAAMTGVLVGLLKEGELVGEIRVAGPDAAIVRESSIALKRK